MKGLVVHLGIHAQANLMLMSRAMLGLTHIANHAHRSTQASVRFVRYNWPHAVQSAFVFALT